MLKDKSSPLKRGHPALQNHTFLPFFLLLRVIFACLDPDPDPGDQNQCGSGSGSGSTTLKNVQVCLPRLDNFLPRIIIYKKTVCQLRLHLQCKYQLKILMRIQIQIRGGGRSAKNVHPPWQNPRYAPALYNISLYQE